MSVERESTPGRILIVDDNVELRRVLGRILRRAGHEIVEAFDGRAAIEWAEREEFDAVISDVRMPEVDGVELLRALREHDEDLPVLLISGTPDLDTALRAIEYGAFEFLMKPVDATKLRDSVARAVAQCRDRREAEEMLGQMRSRRRIRVDRSLRGDTSEGATVGGLYKLGALIGQGGMGSVYEGVREDIGLEVAIKILRNTPNGEAQLAERFRREAEIVAKIDHPNIVKIFDFQASGKGPAILVMERLRGMSLGKKILLEGPLDTSLAVTVVRQVLAALSAAHACQVVHRDLKPENIFLTAVPGVGCVVRVLDFGIAKTLGNAGDPKLTRTGMVLGTPAYLAPEQARGDDVDPRSDLYAAGSLLYEALTGRPPFTAENYNALLVAIQEAPARSIHELRGGIDPDLVRVVEKAMAKSPRDRYQSANEMFDALEPWAAPSPSLLAPSFESGSFQPVASELESSEIAASRGPATSKGYVPESHVTPIEGARHFVVEEAGSAGRK